MIPRFVDEHCFLSNFYFFDVKYEGVVYPTAEHAFQAAKCVNPKDRDKILKTKTPAAAKSLGRRIRMKLNWNSERLAAMERILKMKFSDPELRLRLKNTSGEELIEGNYWHDQFWGTCICLKHKNIKGENMLGKLLMKIRDSKDFFQSD